MTLPFTPAKKAYNSGTLKLDDTHTLFYEECGNPNGIPVVVLHGGPGGGHSIHSAKFFDPAAFRIILYDQRGAGQSTPAAELKDNDPDHLVEDLEKLRAHLGVEKWHVFGGSWGSTLGLLYAEAHPDKVKSLTLSGIFMMRAREIDWFVNKMGTTFPEAQEQFEKFLPRKERKNLLSSYFNRLAHPDPKIHLPAAHAWAKHEMACVSMRAYPFTAPLEPEDALNIARIEAHYMQNNRFRPDDRILKDAHKIRHIPAMIVQGRFDVICPPTSAYDLKKAFPEACLQFVQAGHGSMDRNLHTALVAATERIKKTGTPVPPAQTALPGPARPKSP